MFYPIVFVHYLSIVFTCAFCFLFLVKIISSVCSPLVVSYSSSKSKTSRRLVLCWNKRHRWGCFRAHFEQRIRISSQSHCATLLCYLWFPLVDFGCPNSLKSLSNSTWQLLTIQLCLFFEFPIHSLSTVIALLVLLAILAFFVNMIISNAFVTRHPGLWFACGFVLPVAEAKRHMLELCHRESIML